MICILLLSRTVVNFVCWPPSYGHTAEMCLKRPPFVRLTSSVIFSSETAQILHNDLMVTKQCHTLINSLFWRAKSKVVPNNNAVVMNNNLQIYWRKNITFSSDDYLLSVYTYLLHEKLSTRVMMYFTEVKRGCLCWKYWVIMINRTCRSLHQSL